MPEKPRHAIGRILAREATRGLRGLAWMAGAGVTVWAFGTAGLAIAFGMPLGIAAGSAAALMLIVFVLAVVLANVA